MARSTAREAILEAAERLLGGQRSDEVSMARVREEAGVSNGTLFHFFPTRQDLIAALYLRAAEAYQDAIVEALAGAPSARAGLAALVTAHVAWVLQHPGPARFLHEMRRGAAEQTVEEAIRARNQSFAARLAAWVRPYVAAGELAPLPPDVFGAVLFGPVHLLTRDWLRTGDAGALRAAARPLADAVAAALASRGRPARRPLRRPAGARGRRGRSTPRSAR